MLRSRSLIVVSILTVLAAALTDVSDARGAAQQDSPAAPPPAAPPAAAPEQTAPSPLPSADTPASIEEAMRAGEARRLAATDEAIRAVASGDPVAALLALDHALELSPADLTLLNAKRSVESAAIESALLQARRLRAEGKEREAFDLLGKVRGAADDERLDAEWKALRIVVGAREDRVDDRARRMAEDARQAGDATTAEARDRARATDDRLGEIERRLDRLTTSPIVGARAEPAIDGLDRRVTEGQRDLERQIFELRRELERYQREVDSLRRDVERLRNRP